LFASNSIADFVNREYYYEKMIASDLVLLDEIKDKVASVKETKKKLDVTIAESRTLASNLTKKKSEIQTQAKYKKKIYNDLSSRRKEFEKRVAELEKGSKDLENLINRSKTTKKVQPKATGKMIWPAKGRLVSGYGYRRHPLWGGTQFHTGIDIGTPYGDPIRAADGGQVIFSGWWNGYGKAVVIDHGKGTSTVYGHMSRIYAQAGQKVGKSQILGLIGSTGFSTGPHLHFEIRKYGKTVNPLGYLK